MLLGLTTAAGNGQSGSECGAAPVVVALLGALARVRTPPLRTRTSGSPLGTRRAPATSAVRIDVIWAGLVARTDAMSAFPSRRERQPTS
jgi:hypothetical protein